MRQSDGGSVKVLIGSGRLGPMTAFLPDGTYAAVPSAPSLTEPMIAQARARGSQATFEEHAKRLAGGPPYAGKWSLLEVPDGISASQALHCARYRAASGLLR